MPEENQSTEKSEMEMGSPMEGGQRTDETKIDGNCDQTDQNSICENIEFNFDDTLFQEPGRGRITKTRAKKRQERRRQNGCNATRDQLIEGQQKDPDIQAWKAREDSEAVDIRNGVLC